MEKIKQVKSAESQHPSQRTSQPFVDFTSPWSQSFTPKDSRTELRTVIGFRILLR
jgi:hypothetical protein